MPSTPTDSLRLELQETGEGLNVWGSTLNRDLRLLEQAICGILIKPLTGNYTLTTALYQTDEARNATLVFTAGAGLSAAPTVTVPPAPKSWHVDNRTGYPVTFTMGGSPVTVLNGRQADVFCDGANLFMLEPVAAAAAVTQGFADQAAASAIAAASASGTATQARNTAIDNKNYAIEWAVKAVDSLISTAAGGNGTTDYSARHFASKASGSATAAAGAATNAANSATAAANSAAGVNLPAVTAADAGKVLTVKSDGSGYTPILIPPKPALAPIVVSSPPDNSTVMVTQTFVAKLNGYAADTQGFYSDYGHPQASRTLNVYQASSPSVIFKTTGPVAGAGNSLTVNLQTLGLATSTNYLAEIVFTDVLGNTTTSAKSRFTAPAQWRPNIGDAYQGGYYTGQINDGGTVYDLIVAPKSGGETAAQWSVTSTTNALSRTNGPGNTSTIVVATSANPAAANFCDQLVLNGYSDWYLPAIDELELAYRNLKPTTGVNTAGQGANANSVPSGAAYTTGSPAQTTVAAFQTGASEAFIAGIYWTSTEASASNANFITFTSGQQSNEAKTNSRNVRAFRRVPA
jgi:hypothetical protein